MANHLEDPSGPYVPPNADGIIYRASTWSDGGGRRLILLSEIC